jgi:hypothetical protein
MSDVSGVVAGAACHMEQHVTARRNVVRMLIVVVIVFIICYLPVHLLNICRYLPSLSFVSSPSGCQTYSTSIIACKQLLYNILSKQYSKLLSLVH